MINQNESKGNSICQATSRSRWLLRKPSPEWSLRQRQATNAMNDCDYRATLHSPAIPVCHLDMLCDASLILRATMDVGPADPCGTGEQFNSRCLQYFSGLAEPLRLLKIGKDIRRVSLCERDYSQWQSESLVLPSRHPIPHDEHQDLSIIDMVLWRYNRRTVR